MRADIAPGERVRLRYRHEIFEGIVATLDGNMLCVSSQSEWARAKAEHREPESVAFNRSEIILEEPPEHSQHDS
jgi:hypothetical protein